MANLNINLSTEDLYKLIGDTPLVQLNVSQQIADEFAKRHLKSLINDENIRKIADEFKTIKKDSWGRDIKYYQLKPEISNSIKDTVSYTLEKMVTTLAEKFYEERKQLLERLIEVYIKTRVEDLIKNRIKDTVESELKILEESIEDRLKNIINKITIGINKKG